jgi:hypothetical protein
MKLEAIIVTLIAIFVFLQGYLTSDEAFKYCNPTDLFWLKAIVGALAAGGIALKSFMSSTYSDWKKDTSDDKADLTPPPPQPQSPKPIQR